MQLNSIPLINDLYSEVNPIPVKAALNKMRFEFGIPRLPLVEKSWIESRRKTGFGDGGKKQFLYL